MSISVWSKLNCLAVFAGEDDFAEVGLIGEADGETAQAIGVAGREGGDDGGIQTRGEEDAEGDVGDEMIFYGVV
jgi:hypothetical protein